MLGGVTGPAAPPNVHSSQTRAPRDDLAVLRNRTFTELTVGESAGLERTLTPQDIQLFAIDSFSGEPAPRAVSRATLASPAPNARIPLFPAAPRAPPSRGARSCLAIRVISTTGAGGLSPDPQPVTEIPSALSL